MLINNLKNGDLLFMRDQSDFSKAIIETTAAFSHVGIFFDGLIYHASRKNGVTKQKLEDYLQETKQEVFIFRYPDIDAKSTKEGAEKYLGLKYNHSFYPDKKSFYCSQYIAEILPIFDTVAMKFGDGTNEVSAYWKQYFDDLGVEVPLNQPGTNPSQLSQSDKLEFAGKLEY